MCQGWPRMVLRIIRGFCCGCAVSEFQDAPGWVQGWPRMVLRIILGFCGGCAVSEFQDALGWVKDVSGWS